MTQISKQKFEYLEKKTAFKVKLKAFFIIFTGLSIAKNCLRPKIAPLIHNFSSSARIIIFFEITSFIHNVKVRDCHDYMILLNCTNTATKIFILIIHGKL